MKLVVIIIMLLIVLNFVLKLSFHRFWGIIVMCIVPLLFMVTVYDFASMQSKTQIEIWLLQPDLMLDTAVILTIDAIFHIAFGLFLARKNSTDISRKELFLLSVTHWIPGIFLFPVLFSILVEVIFLMPGIDFSIIGCGCGITISLVSLILVYIIKHVLPEEDLRLEFMFLINLIIIALGVVVTVNGHTAAAGTNFVKWDALACLIILLIISSCIGLIYHQIHTNIKLRQLK